MPVYDPPYKTEFLDSWDSVENFFSERRAEQDGWIYRGQQNAGWPLETTLERAIARRQVSLSKAPKIEKGLVRRFRRQIHLYPNEMPISCPNFMETLALIQHHGGPTRLLDWSYSFFVGVYFALEAAAPGASCAVWALDRDWWRARARHLLPDEVKKVIERDKNAKSEETVLAILDHSPPLKTIHPLNPLRLSERHVYQQGAFLVPGDITVPFMGNLGEIAVSSEPDHLIKIEIKCSCKLLQEATENLHRMNVNRASLFPGLDGFVKHLEQLIAIERARAVD